MASPLRVNRPDGFHRILHSTLDLRLFDALFIEPSMQSEFFPSRFSVGRDLSVKVGRPTC